MPSAEAKNNFLRLGELTMVRSRSYLGEVFISVPSLPFEQETLLIAGRLIMPLPVVP
jgi:hypothetical protein